MSELQDAIEDWDQYSQPTDEWMVPLVNAARRVADGEPTRVCASHGWSIVKADEATMCVVGLWLTEPKDPCEVVNKLLIDPPEGT